jgi:hypothetical protein
LLQGSEQLLRSESAITRQFGVAAAHAIGINDRSLDIACDRDDAGEKAAAKHAEKLIDMLIECFRVLFPRAVSAWQPLMKRQAAKLLASLLGLTKGTLRSHARAW